MNRLEHDLAGLKQRALAMGAMAESMVEASSRAIIHADPAAVRKVLAAEPALDDMQFAIDRETIRLITVYSPAARDLRFLLMMVRITSNFERMGDQAVNNCEYVELLMSHPRPLAELARMSELALRMVRETLQAFRDDDAARAQAVVQLDREIDAVAAQIIRDALQGAATDHDIAARSAGLLVARSFERVADYATNICEEVFYVVEGEDIRQAT